MARYKIGLIEVEAVQWDGTPESARAIVAPHGYIMRYVAYETPDSGAHISIEAGGSGSNLRALPGDWIVKHGYAGYAVLPDLFFLAVSDAGEKI